jgi:plastocyanin
MRTMMRWTLLVAAVGLAGCGDDASPALDGAVNMDLSANSKQDMQSPLNFDLAGVMIVTVGPNDTLTFAPDSVNVNAGDKVLWLVSSGDHTVTSGPFTGPGAGVPDGKFCSGAPNSPSAAACAAETGHGPGFTYEHEFPTAGVFPYFCNVHGITMHGTINVQ